MTVGGIAVGGRGLDRHHNQPAGAIHDNGAAHDLADTYVSADRLARHEINAIARYPQVRLLNSLLREDRLWWRDLLWRLVMLRWLEEVDSRIRCVVIHSNG